MADPCGSKSGPGLGFPVGEPFLAICCFIGELVGCNGAGGRRRLNYYPHQVVDGKACTSQCKKRYERYTEMPPKSNVRDCLPALNDYLGDAILLYSCLR